LGAGQIFNLPRTDDFSRRGKVPSHLTAKVVSTVAFQNKIKNLSCTLFFDISQKPQTIDYQFEKIQTSPKKKSHLL